jgi:hypothetical protein
MTIIGRRMGHFMEQSPDRLLRRLVGPYLDLPFLLVSEAGGSHLANDADGVGRQMIAKVLLVEFLKKFSQISPVEHHFPQRGSVGSIVLMAASRVL